MFEITLVDSASIREIVRQGTLCSEFAVALGLLAAAQREQSSNHLHKVLAGRLVSRGIN